MSSILAERVDVAIGVDSHTDTHTAVIVTSVGAAVAELTVAASPAGVGRVVAWVDGHTAGQRRAWVIDGSRSHGIGLTRCLREAGETIIEAPRWLGRDRRGKSDSLDAANVARAALAAPHGATPRADGEREALRILTVCRRHYTDTRTATVNLFKSLILTADDDLREQLRGLDTGPQVRQAAHLIDAGMDAPGKVRRQQLRTLAAEISVLDRLIAENLKQIRALVRKVCPALLEQPGIGPITAAIAYTAWSHRGRCRNEAAFAALAGVNPIPASSGRTNRHRLNRGGDRILNSAIHTIAKIRRRCHQPTRDYVARRTADGRNPREINRCLKRYIARQLFRIMEATT